MWTPYSRLISDVDMDIDKILILELKEVDWAVVKRYINQISRLKRKKWQLEDYESECRTQMERTALFKEELVTKVFHPRNVERWLQQNIYDMMFGC